MRQYYDLVVLGSGYVGKTSLIQQCGQGFISLDIDLTTDDSYSKQVEVDGKQYSLEIWDTAQVMSQYAAAMDLYVRNGKGFVLVYSITSQSSFNRLGDLRDQIIRAKDTIDVPMVLVGNKCDLEDERVVAKDQGQALAKQFGNCTFMETSAKTKINVTEVFIDLVRQINRKTPEVKKTRRNFFKRCVIL